VSKTSLRGSLFQEESEAKSSTTCRKGGGWGVSYENGVEVSMSTKWREGKTVEEGGPSRGKRINTTTN